MARLRTVERAEAVLDRAARMQQFRAPLLERRLGDRQMRTPGYHENAFSLGGRNPGGLKATTTIERVPIAKIRTEQPTVSLDQAKAKLRSGPGAPAQLIAHRGYYHVEDGNHGLTAARARGQTHVDAAVTRFNGEIKPPVSITPAKVARGARVASTIASPLLVGSNAALAYQARINQGGDSVEAMGDALVAGGETAASGMVIGTALRTANSFGFKTAASFAGRALIPLSVAAHATAYGVAAWNRGEGGAGIAKAAAWGAVNGVLPIDATVEAFSNFNQANRSYNHSHQGVGQEETAGEGRKGWGNKARAASAAARNAKWDHPDE